jgi:hypothetical protein
MKKDLCQYGHCTRPAKWVYGPTDKGKYIKVCTQHRNKLVKELTPRLNRSYTP